MSGLTPRLRGDGYDENYKRANYICRVRTYAPFERGWLLKHWVCKTLYYVVWSGLTPRLRGDGYVANMAKSRLRQRVRTYAPFERGWLLFVLNL